jgi:hypothetical protein
MTYWNRYLRMKSSRMWNWSLSIAALRRIQPKSMQASQGLRVAVESIRPPGTKQRKGIVKAPPRSTTRQKPQTD